MYKEPRPDHEPPYIRELDEMPEGMRGWTIVGPTGKWSFRLECPASAWKPKYMLLLWELMQDAIADYEKGKPMPNLSVVRAETDLMHAFSAARQEASESALPRLARLMP